MASLIIGGVVGAGASLRPIDISAGASNGPCLVHHPSRDAKCCFRELVRLRKCISRGQRATRSSLHGATNWASGGKSLDVEKYRSRLEALLFCGKEVPEEKIEKPAGVPARPLDIGNKPRCIVCDARGAVECATCTGSGLYVDSVLESQGIIVKVKCLGCGGSGSTMCRTCGGRGHT